MEGDRPAWFGWDRPVLALKAQCPRNPLGPSKVAVWSLAGGTLGCEGRAAEQTGQTHSRASSRASGRCREGTEQRVRPRPQHQAQPVQPGSSGHCVRSAGPCATPAPGGHHGPCVQRHLGLLNPFLGAPRTSVGKCAVSTANLKSTRCSVSRCAGFTSRAPSAAVCSWLMIGDP